MINYTVIYIYWIQLLSDESVIFRFVSRTHQKCIYNILAHSHTTCKPGPNSTFSDNLSYAAHWRFNSKRKHFDGARQERDLRSTMKPTFTDTGELETETDYYKGQSILWRLEKLSRDLKPSSQVHNPTYMLLHAFYVQKWQHFLCACRLALRNLEHEGRP